MSNQILSEVINNFQDLNQVVDCINNGGTPLFTPEEIAGQYIATCIEDDEFKSVETLCECHWDVLIHWGVDSRFEFENVLQACKETLEALDKEYFGEG